MRITASCTLIHYTLSHGCLVGAYRCILALQAHLGTRRQGDGGLAHNMAQHSVAGPPFGATSVTQDRQGGLECARGDVCQAGNLCGIVSIAFSLLELDSTPPALIASTVRRVTGLVTAQDSSWFLRRMDAGRSDGGFMIVADANFVFVMA